MESIEITFLGTGTSHGVPVIGCGCAVCSSPDSRDHRTRTSLLVRTPECHFVIDTTPDFRAQCLREGLSRLDAALFTHHHTDHIMGFDDMRRFCEMQDLRMPVFASPATMEALRKAFPFAFEETQSWKNYLRLNPSEISGSFQLGETTVFPYSLPHGKMVTMGFVFRRHGRRILSYFTDCSRVPEDAIEAARGSEILILDALRDRSHPTHMNFEQALKTSRAIAPLGTYFVHLSHDVSHARKAAELPEHCTVAHDGLTIRVGGA